MANELDGGAVIELSEVEASEYLPNEGVFLAGIIGKDRAGFGLYRGTMRVGCEISREIHPETSETVYILSGAAVGVVGDVEVPLGPGQVLHVDKNVHHGLRNVGDEPLEFLVIGQPDF